MKNKQTLRKKVWKLKENNMRAGFQERVKELVDVDVPNVWNAFQNGILKAFDEVCGNKKGRRNYRKNNGGMRW